MNIPFIKSKISVKTIFSLFFTFAISLIFVFAFSGSAFAAKKSDHVLHGYIWSDNIGWISLNCADTSTGCGSDYKVVIDYTTGQLSGYGWSSNIGWISFNSSSVSGCPAKNSYNNSCTPTAVLSSGTYGTPPFPQILGWARALSHNSSWDGWISLSCYNTNGCGTNNYGVVLPNDSANAITTDGSLTGYAWGSTVTGWLNFAGVTVVRGSSEITLKAFDVNTNDPVTSVGNINDTIKLEWASTTNTDYDSCSASVVNGSNTTWTGNVIAIDSSNSYTMSKTVDVQDDPTTFKIECTAGAQTDTAEVTIDIDYVWDLFLTAVPDTILSGMDSVLSWTKTGNMPANTTCAPTFGWTSSKDLPPSSDTVTNITSSISYGYRCTPPDTNDEKTATTLVKILSIVRFQSDSCYRSSDGGPTISWAAPNASSCTITDPNSNNTSVGISGVKKFAGGPGTYTITCTGGAYSVDDTLNTIACVPDYTMVPLPMCNGKSGQKTDNSFQPFGMGQYKALIKVDSVPESGFSSQLRYVFTMPSDWITNNWSINGWSRIGLTDNYESPIVTPPNYNSTFEVVAPSLASLSGLNFFPKKTQTFTVNGDTNPSLPMARSASYTICAPDGGSSKPIFIEQ